MQPQERYHFLEYDAPLIIFDAFKLQSDGEGFLKEMLHSVHPNLKPPTEDTVTTKPKFEDYENIHVFVDAFINWLNDEKVQDDIIQTEKILVTSLKI